MKPNGYVINESNSTSKIPIAVTLLTDSPGFLPVILLIFDINYLTAWYRLEFSLLLLQREFLYLIHLLLISIEINRLIACPVFT